MDTFESTVATPLRYLRQQGMLRTEERFDVRPELRDHESKVYVRALAGAIAPSEEGSPEEGVEEFASFDKVRQVELVSRLAVVVRNRADHTRLRQVEADSAGLVYYPGRVFEDSRGRFVVVGRTGTWKRPGAVEVEPALYDEVSSPRRCWQITEGVGGAGESGGFALSYPLFEPDLVLLGRDPVEIGLLRIRARIDPVGTYHLDRATGEIRSRELHIPAVHDRFRAQFLTVALVLRPNPSQLPPGAPALRFAEARLLAALLRFLLPFLYRDVRDHLDVALQVQRPAARKGPPQELASPAWDAPLSSQDSLYLLDLHQEGNGTARALYRDGLELPLRFCRHFLAQISDLRRLQVLYDHWGDRNEILAEGHADERSELRGEAAAQARELEPEVDKNAPTEKPLDNAVGQEGNGFATVTPWQHAREGLLSWLDSRLQREPVRHESEEGSPPDAGEAA